MPITTYLSQSECELYKSVGDKDLNELFQEIRNLDDRFLLHERTMQTKRWFRKPKINVLYTLYIETSHGEVQIMNFAREWKWSINTSVPAPYIYAYFYGFLGGMKSQINSVKQLLDK